MSHDIDSHPSRARLVACVDGEVPADERERLSRHVEQCRRCERRVEEIRESARTFSEAVGHIQPPPSDATADGIRRRADRRDDAAVAGHVAPDEETANSGFRWTTATRIAASVVVLLGAAAALPGSPVRSWIDRSVEGVQQLFSGGEEAAPESSDAAPAARPEITDRSGVAVAASDGSIRIRLTDVPTTTTIRVRLVDGPQAGVWNAGGQYQTAPGRIEVRRPASEALLVEIPRSVNRVRLEVNGEIAVVKRNEVLDVRVPGSRLEDGEFTFSPSGTQ